MRTFNCDGCYEKCCVTIQFGSNPPRRCHHDDNISNWHEVKEEEQKLPKLTTEVFDRPDCPAWANYAVINHNGRLSFFGDKPKFEGEDYGCWSCYNYKYIHINNAFFDPSDWQNSLIERPAKTLPEWCKVGEWVYADPEKVFGPAGYKKIKATDGLELTFTDGCCIYFSDKVEQARPRPFNEKEMRELVGKVFTTVDGDVSVATDFDNIMNSICICSEWFKSDELANSIWQIDGKPCYVLEHKNEKGEWVK